MCFCFHNKRSSGEFESLTKWTCEDLLKRTSILDYKPTLYNGQELEHWNTLLFKIIFNDYPNWPIWGMIFIHNNLLHSMNLYNKCPKKWKSMIFPWVFPRMTTLADNEVWGNGCSSPFWLQVNINLIFLSTLNDMLTVVNH